MSNDEDLKAKYGRKTNSKDTTQNTTNKDVSSKSEEEAKYGRNNTYTKKTKETLTQQQKDIKANIASVISQYTQEHQSFSQQMNTAVKKEQEPFFVKIIKNIISICIVAIVICIVIALIARPQINIEGDIIIEQIKKAEDLYYSKMHKYHYFTKTNYDQTLGIDLSQYKYFINYEVIPNEESGNYEAKLYGATNAFTMTYYYLKALMKEKGILA